MPNLIVIWLSVIISFLIGAQVFADEISTERSTSFESGLGSQRTTQSERTNTDGLTTQSESKSINEEVSPTGGYSAKSEKSVKSSDGLGTVEKRHEEQTTVSP